MDYKIHENLLYTEEHEWIDPSSHWVGITDFAQEELGDIVFVDLPETGRDVQYQDPFMVVESVKAVSDVYAPCDGTVSKVNEAVMDAPETVNNSPYDEGKFIQLDVTGDLSALMSAEEYCEIIE